MLLAQIIQEMVVILVELKVVILVMQVVQEL